ncbi:CNNM domain-containing protein [Alteromonas oceanisediminis]|uniref:CNNM domain-containing protein n=1 Tax=Alteromonas oceanisediminis TaxID=2836180 RepID=UPI001BDAA325|nr:CNNM domain-containing protein [Alteromonas oceanisediminis]MBT0587667.1 DUF21 domain-containing protein [Alteromonas oceanisediminis]
MFLLLVYVLVALGFSFLCSIAEAVILSISPAYISSLKQQKRPSGKLLEKLTVDINQPLAAILSLNTIAHTMGAAGAGAQAAAVFGDAYLGLISAVLTLLILVFSEIIPKTLGATFWRQLAPMTAFFLKYLIIALYPFVKMSAYLTKGFKEDSPLRGLNRNELQLMAKLSAEEGQLASQEVAFVQNVLNLHKLQVKEAVTHRTQVFSVDENTAVEVFFHKHSGIEFSRIPVFEDGDNEKITGYVMRTDLLLAQARGNGAKALREYVKPLVTLLGTMPLSSTFNYFIDNQVHMLLVVDEYGGIEGILTLEDLLEKLLGVDIIDEKDNTVSMKRLARLFAKRRDKILAESSVDQNADGIQ